MTKQAYTDKKFMGELFFASETELTIAAGAITVTQLLHTIDTQDDDPSDDLVTINGGAAGQFIRIRAENAARTIVIKETGNILTGGSDITLEDTDQYIELQYDATLTKWVVVGGAGGGDVSSAANITDHAIVRGDGGAKGIQTTGILVDDADNISGVHGLTATADIDIGAHDLRAATLTADGLTSGRVIFAGASGVLSDSADLTFASNQLVVKKDAIVVTQGDYGLLLQNTTAALVGTQVQYSPPIRQRGTAWDVDGSVSNTVDFRQFVRPIAGNDVTGALDFQASINGGAYSTILSFLNDGTVGINALNPSYAKLEVHGSIFATLVDNIFFALDNQVAPRMGFTKKSGYTGMFAHSNNAYFAIGMTNAATIIPAGFSSIAIQFRVDTTGNITIGPVAQPTGGGAPSMTFAQASGNPTGMPADGASIFAKSDGTRAAMYAIDEDATVTKL